MTPLRTPTTIVASRHPLGVDTRTYDGSYGRHTARPFVVAVVKCAVCKIKRPCVNDVCDVCRANGAGTL